MSDPLAILHVSDAGEIGVVGNLPPAGWVACVPVASGDTVTAERVWVCRADGAEYGHECMAHPTRRYLYNQDEWDDEHNGCGMVTVVAET